MCCCILHDLDCQKWDLTPKFLRELQESLHMFSFFFLPFFFRLSCKDFSKPLLNAFRCALVLGFWFICLCLYIFPFFITVNAMIVLISGKIEHALATENVFGLTVNLVVWLFFDINAETEYFFYFSSLLWFFYLPLFPCRVTQ